MKKLLLLCCCLCFSSLAALAQAQYADPMLSSPLADNYQNDTVKATFPVVFKTDDDKKDFKRLRNFLSEKEGLLAELKAALLRIRPDDPANIPKSLEIQNTLSNLVNKASSDDSIKVDISTATNGFLLGWYPFGEYELEKKRVAVLSKSQLKGKIQMIGDYITQANQDGRKRRTLETNIRLVEQDIADCKRQIDDTLAPEYKEQEFRTQVSFYFASLIALVLVTFFFIVYQKAGNDLSRQLLSDNGLQFVTLFVLIIAVVLFGILNILQSSELAAILAGISGYILGRGNQKAADEGKAGPAGQNDPVDTP